MRAKLSEEELAARRAVSHRKWLLNLPPDRLEAYRAEQREYQRAYRQKNKERVKQDKAERYRRNRAAVLSAVLKWAKANKDKTRESVRKWCRNNKPKRNAAWMARQAAKIRATPPWAELELIERVYAKAHGLGMHVDHVVPLVSKTVCGLHVWANLQLLAATENISKGNRHWPDMP